MSARSSTRHPASAAAPNRTTPRRWRRRWLWRHHLTRCLVDEDAGARPHDRDAGTHAGPERRDLGARAGDRIAGIGEPALDERIDLIAAVVVQVHDDLPALARYGAQRRVLDVDDRHGRSGRDRHLADWPRRRLLQDYLQGRGL